MPLMSRPGAALVLLALMLVPAGAQADELSATRSQPLKEVSHSVALSIDGDVATYVVRRTFANTGTLAEEARLELDLPMGAAVTGLRIRARNRWYSAELMDRDEAAQKYQELTGLGAWEPKDPALLQWVWADQMRLQVFPVLPAGTNTVEYTLTAPLHYRQGRYVLSYPRADSESDDSLALATPVIRIDPGHGDVTTMVRVDGQPVAPDIPVVLQTPTAPPWVGEGSPSPNEGYAWSELEITEKGSAGSARVDVDIDHTYRGDLTLSLVTPSGVHVQLDDLSGDDNDVHQHFDVQLPGGTRADGTWHLLAADCAGLDVGTIDAWSLTLAEDDDPADPDYRQVASADVPVFIPDAPDGDGNEGLALIEIEAAPIHELEGRYGRAEVDDSLHFLRLDLEAAAELQPVPANASVVFVVDASHSAVDVMDQLKLARGYMAHVPDAKAEVVLFRRFAERVTGDFVSNDDLWAALEKAEGEGRLDPGNGSALEEGLRVAGRALRGRRGPRRIVLFTDARLRTRFRVQDGEEAAGIAPRNTVTHLVVPGADQRETRLVRADDHELAPIAAKTEGVLFELEDFLWHDDKAIKELTLDLVRPTTIDYFEVHGVDLDDAPTVPTTFHEGASYGFMMKSPESPSRITVKGKIWNRDFHRVIRPDRRFSRATAAFVFSEDGLSYDQMMKLAMHGRAVSPVTSYLATEPGVRPSTIGLEGTGRGGGGMGEGTIGLGSTGLIGKGGGGGSARKAFTIEELLEEGVQACVDTHAPTDGWRVDLDIESTSREIVDVEGKSGPAALRKCMVEAAWAVRLTWNFADERKMHRVRLGG